MQNIMLLQCLVKFFCKDNIYIYLYLDLFSLILFCKKKEEVLVDFKLFYIFFQNFYFNKDMLNVFLEKFVIVIYFVVKDYKLNVNSIDFKINIFERKY